MPSGGTRAHWSRWLARWDEQQTSFNPDRERRFSAMLDIVEAAVGRRFVALDLGAGPGSLSARLLDRFPRARCVAVDYDPVVQRIGRGALGTVGGRLTWVDARLGASGWTAALPTRRFDAALSTTALHWLPPAALRRLYRDLAHLVRRGGVVLNGDHLPDDRAPRAIRGLTDRVREIRQGGNRNAGWAEWRRWWREAARDPALREEFRLQAARSAAHPKIDHSPLELHERALRQAGFRDVWVVWSDLGNRVLYARR